eukprot:TRINITY_DN50585_c0_g1_i1.p1 TRINITY_DN50585_c0_g1~~TRINITY_DN50585_c0_g1_i1.p1  ORF type:complete len:144 (-),score=27.23 TRINITY_DN50585_c0_g1_i1:114-545(-)
MDQAASLMLKIQDLLNHGKDQMARTRHVLMQFQASGNPDMEMMTMLMQNTQALQNQISIMTHFMMEFHTSEYQTSVAKVSLGHDSEGLSPSKLSGVDLSTPSVYSYGTDADRAAANIFPSDASPAPYQNKDTSKSNVGGRLFL